MDVSDNPPPSCTQAPKRGLAGVLLIIGGTLCVSLGFIGMFVPLLPTTPFLLLAAVCYAHSSQRFYLWLLTNRWCGQYIRRYREGKGVLLRQKVLAILLLWMTIGYAAGFVVSAWWLKAVLIAIAVGVTIHLVRVKTFRPEDDDFHKIEGSDSANAVGAVCEEGRIQKKRAHDVICVVATQVSAERPWMKNRKRIAAAMILAVCSLGFALAIRREGNLPVNPDSIPVMFVVIARGSDGKYIPAVLYEWSSYVQGTYRPPIYHKIRETSDFDPHWAGMMIVSDDERSHYDFRVPVADVVQAENDLNNLPAAFGSNATYGLDVHDSENGYATELTLYRSTNGSNVFRYRINDGSVTPLRFGGTGRFTSMVTLLVVGFVAVVAFFSMLFIALIRGNDPRFEGGEEGTVDG